MTKPCRKYDGSLHEINNLPEWQDSYKRNAQTFDILARNAGFTFDENKMYDNLQNVFDCFNELMIEVNKTKLKYKKNYNRLVPIVY